MTKDMEAARAVIEEKAAALRVAHPDWSMQKARTEARRLLPIVAARELGRGAD